MILLSTLTLVINACSLLPQPPRVVEIKTVEVRIPIQHPVYPRPIDMKEPRWYVVSKKNLDSFIEKVEKEAGQLVFMAMTPGDYELMAYNLQEIKRYVKETKEVIVYYRTVISDDVETEVQESEAPDKESFLDKIKGAVSDD